MCRLLFGFLVVCVGCIESPEQGFQAGQRYATGGSFGGADPVLTPGGGIILFSAPSGNELGNIFSLNTADGRVSPVISAAGYQGQVDVSPDGKSIVYISEEFGLPAVWVANKDGTNARRLTNAALAEESPRFSNDGRKVAFVRRLTMNPDARLSDEVFVIDVDGHSEQRVTNDRFVGLPVRFSEDGASLYITAEGGCNDKRAPTDGAHLFKVSLSDKTTQHLLQLGKYAGQSVLSVDEKTVVYVDDRQTPFAYDVWSVNIDGSNRRQLTDFGGYIGSVRFGFHSDRFVFLVEPRCNGTGDIYLYELATSRQQKVGSTSLDQKR
jgi:Tol biopolymer transport system component